MIVGVKGLEFSMFLVESFHLFEDVDALSALLRFL